MRLPGLEARSPVRIVLDRQARLPLSSKLVGDARTRFRCSSRRARKPIRPARRRWKRPASRFLATETFEGRVALPELLEDLAGQGISSVMVEGGAETARAFLDDGLVDRIVLFRGEVEIGADGIASPIDETTIPAGFALKRDEVFGKDRCLEWTRGI